MSNKPIIVFEGIEGSGKSYHIKKVSKYLKKKKISYLKIREPGGSLNSEKIRRLILNKKSNFNVQTDLLLYLAARSENINLIKKFYKKKIILIDRFTDSTIAYQHYGMGINKKLINQLNNFILQKIKVDFTFLNLVDSKNLKNRLNKRKSLNRYDRFKIPFYLKIQKGFLNIIQKNKRKYMVINSNLDIKFNKDKIVKKVNSLL